MDHHCSSERKPYLLERIHLQIKLHSFHTVLSASRPGATTRSQKVKQENVYSSGSRGKASRKLEHFGRCVFSNPPACRELEAAYQHAKNKENPLLVFFAEQRPTGTNTSLCLPTSPYYFPQPSPNNQTSYHKNGTSALNQGRRRKTVSTAGYTE